MQTQDKITLQEFCMHQHIEISFVEALQERGLIELDHVDATPAVSINQLPELEKMARFYYEMEINLEGIETIAHLLRRIDEMQQEMIRLNNRLDFYEPGDNDL
ncbi:MAG: MerR family transcriptional regulator [Terrimonas sp.]|nr:MerR family transcriptional regulator [Terrimonas sp.]